MTNDQSVDRAKHPRIQFEVFLFEFSLTWFRYEIYNMKISSRKLKFQKVYFIFYYEGLGYYKLKINIEVRLFPVEKCHI